MDKCIELTTKNMTLCNVSYSLILLNNWNWGVFACAWVVLKPVGGPRCLLGLWEWVRCPGVLFHHAVVFFDAALLEAPLSVWVVGVIERAYLGVLVLDHFNHTGE